MIIILHGEDVLTSYKRLSELIENYKTKNIEVVIKDAVDLDVGTLRQVTGSSNLFGTTKSLIIKSLLAGTKSKNKENLVESLKITPTAEVILYEIKKLTDSQLKQLPNAKIELFTINPVIFKFLDLLRPGNTRVILQGWSRLLNLGHEPEYVFSMLVRQVRLLIQAKSGPSYLKLSPYPKKLISAQANFFTLNKLLDLHHHLYEIDKRVKTGLSPLPLDQLLLQFFYLL